MRLGRPSPAKMVRMRSAVVRDSALIFRQAPEAVVPPEAAVICPPLSGSDGWFLRARNCRREQTL